jgi:hypothetical protein
MNVAGIKASQRKKGSWMESFHLAMLDEERLTWQKKLSTSLLLVCMFPVACMYSLNYNHSVPQRKL